MADQKQFAILAGKFCELNMQCKYDNFLAVEALVGR